MAKGSIASPMQNIPPVPSPKSGTGTLGHEPGEPWSKYPQSQGPDTIPNKTRDAITGTPANLDTPFQQVFKGDGVGSKK